MRHTHWLLIVGVLTGLAAPCLGAENLLRNGSFEGSLLYWHNIDPAVHRLARGERL